MKKKKNKITVGFSSPLRYPGGKTRLASFLWETIKKNFGKEDKITLVEPYAGGAGASLKLLFENKVEKLIINDLDRAIFCFWKTAVKNTDFLIEKIKTTYINLEERQKQKNIYKNHKSKNKDLAFATLFLNRTNYSGIINAGPIGGSQQKSKWNIQARFNKKIIIERLEKIKKFKNQIEIKNLDGVNLLKKLKKDNYFIFLDPPYYEKGRFLYLNHYVEKNHQDLLKFLKKTSLKWVMTYDNVSYITNLYEKFNKKEFTLNHSAFKSKKGKEIMIFADNVNQPLEIKI